MSSLRGGGSPHQCRAVGARPDPLPAPPCSAVDSHAFADALVSKGYLRLVIQKGAGEYVPCVLLPDGAAAATLDNGLTVE